MRKILLLALMILFLYGCDCFCSNNYIIPAFIGFSKSELDTVIVRRFKPHDNYSNLIDSVIIADLSHDSNCCHPFRYSIQGDTTLIFTYVDTVTPIRAGYDWQIYIPTTRSTISISEIENGNQVNCKGCVPNIASFVQNTKLVNAPERVNDLTSNGGYRVYISR